MEHGGDGKALFQSGVLGSRYIFMAPKLLKRKKRFSRFFKRYRVHTSVYVFTEFPVFFLRFPYLMVTVLQGPLVLL